MKAVKWLQDFKFTAGGGIAIYMLLCTAYVTAIGLYGLAKWIWRLLS